jgi:hypothetical protein
MAETSKFALFFACYVVLLICICVFTCSEWSYIMKKNKKNQNEYYEQSQNNDACFFVEE